MRPRLRRPRRSLTRALHDRGALWLLRAPKGTTIVESRPGGQLRLESMMTGCPGPEEDAGVAGRVKPALGLWCSVECAIRSVPVRSLLTKKIAPPPSGRGCPDDRAADRRRCRCLRRCRWPRRCRRPACRAGPGWRPGRSPGFASWCCPASPRRLRYCSARRRWSTRHRGRCLHDVDRTAWYWLSTRIAAPPRSGPLASQRLPVKRESMTFSWPPRSKMAPPPPPSKSCPVELPSANVMFCTISDGTGLVLAMRRRPHLSRVAGVHVEDPADSAAAQRHLAGPVEDDPGAGIADLRGGLHRDGHRARTTGERDHAARRTARTTAWEVQLAAVPSPTTWSG